MNGKIIRYVTGWVLIFEALFMTPALIVGILYREQASFAVLSGMGFCVSAGLVLTLRAPRDKSMHAREGLVAVALCWLALSMFGALPFVIDGAIPFYIDAWFEVVSGFTTTGSSILSDVESMPRCLLFWRSFTHWIGGMGVLVFVMAILPLAGGNNMYMMKAESPGPTVGKLVPRVKSTAAILYKLYLVMSLTMVVFLLLGGMPLYEALLDMFGTAGTGGLGFKNDSLGSYSPYIQGVTAIFMIMFGVNFNAYYLLARRKPKAALAMTEVRAYLLIILTAILAITVNISGLFSNIFQALHHAAFQVGSIITTTGYTTVDFDQWPAFSKAILVTLMFIGACAGSTGGGIKVQRVVVLGKAVFRELDVMTHPHNVRRVKVDGRVVEPQVIRSISLYLALYLVIFAASFILVSLDNFDMTTNFTAVATTLNNIGPGLSVIGPTGNFSQFSVLSKLVLIFDMLAGRLELFPVMILFLRGTWRNR